MNALTITKAVTKFAVGAGTAKVVSGIIRNNTNPKNVYDAVTITSSGIVVGMMAADATEEYASAKIDEVADSWRKFKNRKKDQTENDN